MPSPQNAIAFPRRSGGNASSITACDRGCSAPPVVPWMTRKTMSAGRLHARPQKKDATVKPVTESISSRLRPNWRESQPDSGRMIAFATR